MVYILDKSKSMGSTFSRLMLPACSMLHNKIAPDAASVVFFGETVTTHIVNHASFFESDEIKSIQSSSYFASVAVSSKDRCCSNDEPKILERLLCILLRIPLIRYVVIELQRCSE